MNTNDNQEQLIMGDICGALKNLREAKAVVDGMISAMEQRDIRGEDCGLENWRERETRRSRRQG